MTERERELLAALLEGGQVGDGSGSWPWCRPMDLGGSTSSHHSTTLRRMIPKGWVEDEFRRGSGIVVGVPFDADARPSRRYRITAKGRDALFNARATA